MSQGRPMLILSVWGMELAWLYASASFIMLAAFNRDFSFLAGVAASGTAMALTAFSRAFCRRPIESIAVQLLGFTLVGLGWIYFQENAKGSFFNAQWLMSFLHHPRSLLQWISLSITLLWLLFFWLDGVKIIKRPKDFYFVRNRFDLGVGIFLAFLLIELLIIVKSGIRYQGIKIELLMFPFFIFGMLAFTLVRNSHQGERHFILGYRGLGSVLSFAVATLLTGTAMVLLFLPQLIRAAEVGFSAFKTAVLPLEPVMVAVLRFIFGGWRTPSNIQEAPEQSAPPGIPIVAGTGESLFYQILGWGFTAILSGVALLLAGWIIYRLLRRLFRAQPRQDSAAAPWEKMWELMRRLVNLALSLANKVAARVRGPQTALQLWHAFLRWGRFSGLSHATGETPLEYGARIGKRFPRLQHDIQQVIAVHSEIVYGFAASDPQTLSPARSALRRLRSPSHLPRRICSLLRP